VEREILWTGIGGQGVQLAAQVLARAATLEDRHVMYLGTYGGTMRGGNTDSTLIVGDAPLSSPPIVSRTWAALAMHHQFWEPLIPKLRRGSVVVVNAPIFEAPLDRQAQRVFEVQATRIAAELGNPMGASLVLLAAFCNLTQIVKLDALIEAMRASVPSYRQQHVEGNAKVLRAGWELLPSGAAPAWKDA
jgi:Pyruvate/2-oxoacid:ferredoxin oxidoreductase gamma subunit